MKYVIIILLVLGALLVWTDANAASYAAKYPRALLVGIVEREGSQHPIHKFIDAGATCYVFGASISCVK